MKTKNKIKTTILTGLLLLPTLFIGVNNTQINNKTSREDHIDYGTITQFTTSGYDERSNYAFVGQKDNEDHSHLWMWGDNGQGQIGNGKYGGYNPNPIDITGGKDPDDATKIFNRELKSNEKITQLALGFIYSGVVVETTNPDDQTTTDQLYMWGYGAFGQLGDGLGEDTNPNPIDITTDELDQTLPEGSKITQLALGDGISGAVVETTNPDDQTTTDQLYMWGYDGFGQLGNGESGEHKEKLKPIEIIQANDENGNPITSIPKDAKITDLSVKNSSKATIEVPTTKDGIEGTMQYDFKWGDDNILTPTQQGDGKFIPTPKIPTIVTKANTLPYIIAGSILGLLLIIAIIISGVFYGKYKKEKTRKQLI